MGIAPELLLFDTCLSEVLQLIHADAMRNGVRFQWKHFFDPSPELLAEFEQLATHELPDLW